MEAHYYCLEDSAFHVLIDEVVKRVKPDSDKRYKWVSGEEAMAMMGIKSKTSLQKLRDQRKIKFANPTEKGFIYEVDSILAYIETRATDTL